MDNLSKRGPPDAIRINVHEAWEVRDWAKHFNVTEAKLKEAVAKVGVMVKDVKAYLGK